MTDNPKIRKLEDARNRVTTNKQDAHSSNRVGASSRQDHSFADGYERALRKQKGHGAGPHGAIQWYHYIQLFLLLGLVAWLMRSCNS